MVLSDDLTPSEDKIAKSSTGDVVPAHTAVTNANAQAAPHGVELDQQLKASDSALAEAQIATEPKGGETNSSSQTEEVTESPPQPLVLGSKEKSEGQSIPAGALEQHFPVEEQKQPTGAWIPLKATNPPKTNYGVEEGFLSRQYEVRGKGDEHKRGGRVGAPILLEPRPINVLNKVKPFDLSSLFRLTGQRTPFDPFHRKQERSSTSADTFKELKNKSSLNPVLTVRLVSEPRPNKASSFVREEDSHLSNTTEGNTREHEKELGIEHIHDVQIEGFPIGHPGNPFSPQNDASSGHKDDNKCGDFAENCAENVAFCNIAPYTGLMHESCAATCGSCKSLSLSHQQKDHLLVGISENTIEQGYRPTRHEGCRNQSPKYFFAFFFLAIFI